MSKLANQMGSLADLERLQPGVRTGLDKDKVYDDTLFELEDVARLATMPRINRLYADAVLSDARKFREAILHTLIPVPRGKKLPRRSDRADTLNTEIEDIDENFLDWYTGISSLDALDSARQEVQRKIDLVINHQEYRDGISGYRRQEITLWRNSLYRFLSQNGFTHAEHINSQTPLFHGLCMSGDDMELDCNEDQQLISPDAYVAKLKSILAEGIKATPNAENLPCLESVFCVKHIKNTYGLIALKFQLAANQKAWSRSGGVASFLQAANSASEGYQLVVPLVQKPVIQNEFEVLIRSSKFFDDLEGAATKDVFGMMDKQQHRAYIFQLAKVLKAEGIPFQMIDPDGTIRPPRTKSGARLTPQSSIEI